MINNVINQTQAIGIDPAFLIAIIGQNKWWIIVIFVLVYTLWSTDSILSVIADFISKLKKSTKGENATVSGRSACFPRYDGREIDAKYELIEHGSFEGRRGAEDQSDLQESHSSDQ